MDKEKKVKLKVDSPEIKSAKEQQQKQIDSDPNAMYFDMNSEKVKNIGLKPINEKADVFTTELGEIFVLEFNMSTGYRELRKA